MIITVDVAVIIDDEKVVLIKRSKEPFKDKLALPGGHVEESDIDLAHAAAHELREETNINVSPDSLTLLTVLDAPGRDTRPRRRISIVFTVRPNESEITGPKAGSDARSVHVEKTSSLKSVDLGFDHFQAIRLLQNK